MSCILEASTTGSLKATKSSLLYSDLKQITVDSTDYFYKDLTAEISGALDASISGSLQASISGSLQASVKFKLPARFCHPNTLLCGGGFAFTGENVYPVIFYLDFGTQIGTVTVDFNAFNLPDRAIIYYNGGIALDTEYRGSSGFNYSAIPTNQRLAFNNSLQGLIDPVTGNTYPLTAGGVIAPDGYPYVTSNAIEDFEKNLPFITQCTLEVYGPLTDTDWEINISCPVP